MKPQDLMVGDWVQNPHGLKGRVRSIKYIPKDNADNYGGYSLLELVFSESTQTFPISVQTFPINDAKPIPITPEILEKNFRVVERSSDGYNLVINSELILAFHLKATLDFWIAQPRDCPNLTYSLPLPRYVHELQHALRLCGIEKEIVL